jgi:deoxyribodipyrimidine photo-lyase
MNSITLFWFRRDLRLEDNAGLCRALKASVNVQPIFIFDTNILNKLQDKKDRRVSFIYAQIERLKQELEQLGSMLWVFYGDPLTVFKELISNHPVVALYANKDYEPYALNRDKAVYDLLAAAGVPFRAFKDYVIFEKDEVLKDDGTPYVVFTPYAKRWKAMINDFYLKSYPSEKLFSQLHQSEGESIISLEEMGFEKHPEDWSNKLIDESIIKNYHNTRDLPGQSGTTRLSVHLRFGTVSIRQLAKVGLETNEKWYNELIWRDFYQHILWHFPHVAKRAFRPAYDHIEWRNDEFEFRAWCDGKTGYPIVDAGMRELNETGFMHNRVRMIVASFLTKHLLIDWRWGEAYFAQKLIDFDLASNNGGWQWAAGSGVDAAPYFRVFNPYIQTEKFDPQNVYIRKWVPEFESTEYPLPIVDHKMARERAIATYKAGLSRG